jgi:DegV family protein with EDD domain
MSNEIKKTGILTDTISDIPQEIVEALGIEIIPVKIHIGDETFLDRVEISSERFFEILVAGTVQPKTSQPSPYDFQVVFEKMLQKYEKVLAIHASAQLSGTYQSAVMAKEALAGKGGERIIVFDTMQASMGEGISVVKAAEMANEGADIEKILHQLESIAKTIKTRFVPDTLTYLQRGGRIGRASALLGNMLNIKPLLGVNKEVYPVEKVRGGKNVVPKLIEQLSSDIHPSDKYRVCILNSNMPAEMAQIEEWLKADKRMIGLMHAKVGPSIGCHVGPKVIGLIWYKA